MCFGLKSVWPCQANKNPWPIAQNLGVKTEPTSTSPQPWFWGLASFQSGAAPNAPQPQVMLIARSKLAQPARANAWAIGTLPKSVEARIRGTFSAARILVPSARSSPT